MVERGGDKDRRRTVDTACVRGWRGGRGRRWRAANTRVARALAERARRWSTGWRVRLRSPAELGKSVRVAVVVVVIVVARMN